MKKPKSKKIKLNEWYTYVRRYLNCDICDSQTHISDDTFYLLLEGLQAPCGICDNEELTLEEEVGRMKTGEE